MGLDPFISVFLAKILGVWMLVIGVALIRNPLHVREVGVAFMNSKASLYQGGMMALFFGLLITLTHNVWEAKWFVFITLMGWLALIKGIFFMIFPEHTISFGRWYLARINIRLCGAIYAVLGLMLCYFGFH